MPESDKKKKTEKKKRSSPGAEAERRRALEDTAASRIQAKFRQNAAQERVEGIRAARLADLNSCERARTERDRVWREQLTSLYLPGFVSSIVPHVATLPSARKEASEWQAMTKLQQLKSGRPEVYKEAWNGWPSDKDIVCEILGEEYRRRVQKDLTSRYPARKTFSSLSKATPTKATVSKMALSTGSMATGGNAHESSQTKSLDPPGTPQMSPVSSGDDDDDDDGKGNGGAQHEHHNCAALSGGRPGAELTVSAAPFAESHILSSAAAVEC